MEEQQKEVKTKIEIERDIAAKFSKVKELCDTCTKNINKSGKTSVDDVFQTNDLIEEIFTELEDLKDFLFDLEDRIETGSE